MNTNRAVRRMRRLKGEVAISLGWRTMSALLVAFLMQQPATGQQQPVQLPTAFIEGPIAWSTDPRIGCGFLVDSNGTIVTAWHVCAGMTSAHLNLGALGEYPITDVLSGDEAADILVLRAAGVPKSAPYFQIANLPPILDDDVRILSLTATGAARVLNGKLRREEPPDFAFWLSIRAEAREGDSGVPVVNEASEVVGVISTSQSASQLCKAAPLATIHRHVQAAGRSPGEPFAAWRKRALGDKADEYVRRCEESRYTLDFIRNTEHAMSQATEGLAANQRGFEGITRVVRAGYQSGHSELQMIEWHRDRLKGMPDSWVDARYLGAALLRLDKYEEAVTALQQSINVRPLPTSRYYLAVALAGSKKPAEAIAVLQDLARDWPEYATGIVYLEALAAAEGRRDVALSAGQTLVKLFPRSPEYLYNLARNQRLFGEAEAFAESKGALEKTSPALANRLKRVIQSDAEDKVPPANPDK